MSLSLPHHPCKQIFPMPTFSKIGATKLTLYLEEEIRQLAIWISKQHLSMKG
jgi:hypothetical protein